MKQKQDCDQATNGFPQGRSFVASTATLATGEKWVGETMVSSVGERLPKDRDQHDCGG
ncbi:hypothetical protein HPP92_025460 [Vanilla planifolia]|uniref:Uncharacterized protein n=1 Tax=Vanilla planifolia TaxID=51239 RepID=A0A835PL25_VANPL|nr:hypothetical protein HPP92_025460 [Vanilla planifolia]